MSQVNPTIIAGTLDDSELLKSIKEIVNAVDSGMDEVSAKFDTKLTEIEGKFKDAGTKIGTAFKYSFNSALGGSFDQLAAAMEKISNSSGKFLNNFGGGNGGAKDLLSQIEEVEEQINDLKIKGITNEEDKARLDAMIEKLQKLQKEKERLEKGPETVGDLDKIIAMEEHRRKRMELESSELLEQNKHLQQAKDYRKEQLATEEQLAKAAEKEAEAIERAESKKLKKEQAPYVKELNRAITMPAKDIDQAQAKLDRLQETKERMVQTGLFDEAQLNRAQNAIDNLQKKIQQIQSKTPKTLKEVMGMDESSVDAITTKMVALKRVQVDPRNKDEVNKLSQEYQRLSNLQSEMLGKNAKLTDSTSLLGKSLTYIVKRLAFIASFALFKGFTSEIVRIRGEYEMLERSLGILIGDMSKGTAIFRQLNAMALQSPFTLMDLAGAAKQLTAYNFAANEVVDTTRRLGDISAALGVPMERLVYNLGQIRAQNVLNARDARDFANAGFAIVPMLAELYTEQKRFGDEIVTTAKVYDMMSKKMVSYADVMQVINKITDEGGKFFDFQSKQADTLKVRIANLSLAYNNMLNEIGKSNQGTMNNVIDSARRMFLSWREVVRVLNTLIVTYGVHRTGIYLTSMAFKRGLVSVLAWMNGIKASTGAMSAFKAALTPNVVIAFATALASAISYFVLFNNSAEETKQKMREITEAFDGIRKNASDLFVAALNTDNLNMQMLKLRELLDLAKNELGITIPVNLEDVNEGNIKQKIQEIKDRLDEYLNFAQAFSESASKTKLNETFNDFGKNAQRVFTGIYESQNTVIEALIKLRKEGRATADELDVLNELQSGRGADESRLDYLRRLISLYERLGIVVRGDFANISIKGAPYYASTLTSFDYKITETQEAIKRLGITNNTVFRNMQVDANTFFTSYDAAYNEFQKTIENIGKRIDVDKIPITERTIKLEAAINEEATRNNWNEYQNQFAKQLANERFGVNIEISDESKSHAETNLKEWQKRLQSWADKNKITLGIAFTENQTPADVASQALQNLKNAQESYQTELRKKGVGTATQEEVDKAKKALEEARKVARATGADLSSLNKGAKKDPLGDALTKEVQVIGDITKRYKEYQQMGVSAQDAIRLATDEYGNTLARLNAQLGKYGIATKTSEELASMDIRGIRDYYNALLEGAKNANNAKGIEALEKALSGINVEITKLDYKKITDGLNNELSKLKDEYELAVELDANPEMSNLFMELFDIDPNSLPQSIDDYAQRVLDKLNKSFEDRKIDFRLPTLNLTDDDINAYKEQLDAGIIDKATFDAVETAYKGLRAMREKNAKETLKSTQELQYKLADVNGKIAIEQKKLADLEIKYQKEANAEKKRLLDLQIQDQRNTIAELQSQALALMPEYERVFGSIIEHSAHTSRRLQKDLLDVYNKATRNANGDYVLTGSDGSTTILTEERYTRERNKLTKEMQKSMSDFKKIKEAFKPSDEDDVVDYAKGIELVGSEIQKLGALMGTIGNIAEGLGFSEESVEILNDVSATLDGLGQATQGYAKIMNGDVIGGLTDMVTGLWNSISAWTDNSDKRITREVEKSERAVRRLELAYKDLEYEVNKAYGTVAVSARQLAIENKKLQLAELERQLALEESRSGKKRDEDRIIDIKGQIKDLRNEINDSVEEITNTLLGISSVGDAVENMVGVVIEALRNGESGIDAFNNSIDDMIFNLMKKWASTKYLAPIVERAMEEINAIVNNETGANELARLQMEQLQIQEALSQAEKVSAIANTKNIIAQLKERYAQNERAIEEAMGSFGMDETKVASIKEILEGLKQEGKGLTDFLTLIFDNFGVDVSGTTANLSALQQGIQGITEDTASALEAYMNGVSQQVYLHSTLLTEIRDAVVGFDLDVQSGTIGEILLQLQQSYQVQMSIESMLNGWNNASGRAIRVEMVS